MVSAKQLEGMQPQTAHQHLSGMLGLFIPYNSPDALGDASPV